VTLHRLRLASQPPPLPAFRPAPPTRPGERREPLTNLTIEEPFARAAAARGLAVAVAVELVLERALVRADLDDLGGLELFPNLLEHARGQQFVAALPAPFRRYRESLRRGEPRELEDDELERPATVPLRFFPRVLSLDYSRALVVGSIDEAIVLELGALCTGRTMSEYALRFACAATRR
jgi:hypothetical protein